MFITNKSLFCLLDVSDEFKKEEVAESFSQISRKNEDKDVLISFLKVEKKNPPCLFKLRETLR